MLYTLLSYSFKKWSYNIKTFDLISAFYTPKHLTKAFMPD